MQEIDDLGQDLLGLVFARNIRKLDTGGRRYINLGVALAEGHCRAAHAAGPHLLGHHAHQQLADHSKDHDGQNPRHQKGDERRRLLHDHLPVGHAGAFQAIHQLGIVHAPGLVDGRAFRIVDECDLILVYLYLLDLAVTHHLQERGIVHLLHCAVQHCRIEQRVEDQQHQQSDDAIENQRFFGSLDFFQKKIPPYTFTYFRLPAVGLHRRSHAALCTSKCLPRKCSTR